MHECSFISERLLAGNFTHPSAFPLMSKQIQAGCFDVLSHAKVESLGRAPLLRQQLILAFQQRPVRNCTSMHPATIRGALPPSHGNGSVSLDATPTICNAFLDPMQTISANQEIVIVVLNWTLPACTSRLLQAGTPLTRRSCH